LSDGKRQQVIALGRPGWPLRRIEKETGVRRETAGEKPLQMGPGYYSVCDKALPVG
jgi:hypothetical protein